MMLDLGLVENDDGAFSGDMMHLEIMVEDAMQAAI